MIDTDLGILLGLAYQGFTDELRATLAAQGFDDLGGAYGYVFRALATEELSQRELASRLAITDQGMAKILTEMIDRGYIERRADAEGARGKRVRPGGGSSGCGWRSGAVMRGRPRDDSMRRSSGA